MSLFEEHARELAGASPEWRVYKFHRIENGALATGAVAPLLVSGDNKGQPNWKKRDITTEKTVFLDDKEHDAWVNAWELRTGLCKHCEGKGEVWKSWSVVGGTEYKKCKTCNGTGKSNRVKD